MPPSLLFPLAHGVAFAAVASTAIAAGLGLLGRIVGWAEAAALSRLEAAALALPLGLAALGQGGLLLGLIGRLRPGPVLLEVAAAYALCWPLARRRFARARSGTLTARTVGAATIVALAALAPFAVLSIYPPTAFDATLYHLPYARQFAAAGAVPFMPALRYPIFPQLQELLFTQVMLFADDVAAQGVTLLATLGTALLLLAWAWRRGPDGRAVGWIAAAAFHLGALGADHLLVMRGKSWPLATDRREFLDLFQPVYADAGAAVFARRNH